MAFSFGMANRIFEMNVPTLRGFVNSAKYFMQNTSFFFLTAHPARVK
jgi:hypothetical protein